VATEVARRSTAVTVCSWLVLAALFILWIGNGTDIDLHLADLAYDRATRSFPLQHAWLAERFNHGILKTALTALGAGTIVLASWDALRPWRALDAARRGGLRVVALSAVFVPLVTSLLKQSSTSHCPWDLQRYGGTEPYVRLLEWLPAGVAPGHCLPAGHASSALWLVSIAVFWWPVNRRRALLVGAALLAFGLTTGWLQQLRGAHFLTHTLWSAWIACATVIAIHSTLATDWRSRIARYRPAVLDEKVV
jgi:membrane-associated PAP2 superfamily phosphatase